MTGPKRFARWLNTVMDNQEIKNTELATALDVSEGTVSRWRNGLSVPKLNNLGPLAKEFGVNALQLAVTAGLIAPEDAGVPPLEIPYPYAYENVVKAHLARLDLPDRTRQAMLEAWRRLEAEERA